jgi:hypothetical protein
MKVKAIKSDKNEIFLIPIGDLHIGEKAFDKESEEKLLGYIDWIKKNKNSYVFLMGDLINCATLNSASNPFQQNMNLQEQIENVVNYFKPIKSQIIGAITGNHEERLEKYCGYNPTISICDRLGIYYFGYDGIVIFRLGCHGWRSTPRASFSIYFHHTTGGGTTIGGKMNRVDRLRNIVCDADAYCGAHNHLLGCVHTGVFKINETTEKVEFLRQMIIDTGGYISYENSYANMKQLPPLKLGSPKIRLLIKRNEKEGKDVVRKDIHVSL